MSRAFVYLVIKDKEVSNFLRRLQAEINGEDKMGEVHLTIRGPYDKIDSAEKRAARWQAMIDKAPVVISGVGMFDNENNAVVFLKVQHTYLRQLWWKPDFPIKEYGFNPHITLYAGSNRGFAIDIFELLTKQKLSLISHHNEIAVSKSKQEELFDFDEPLNSDYLKLLDVRRVPINLLQQVHRVRNHHFGARTGKRH